MHNAQDYPKMMKKLSDQLKHSKGYYKTLLAKSSEGER